MGELPQIPASGLESARIGAPAPGSSRPGAAGPAFEALLERLEARAADLEVKSKSFERPEELPEALDAARASLEDALSLGDKLLEAYRAAQRSGEVAS